jgi:flagellar secretion chaperone FliS
MMMMKLTETALSYRRSAIEGASPIGLMIALFDTLAGDLKRAAGALRKNDIETRCSELNHAALVLGHLENWLDLKNGGESAQTLSRFYAYLRAKMMDAAGTKSAKLLETQIDMILHVRSAWQQLDASPLEQEKSDEFPAEQVNIPFKVMLETKTERIPFSQSA